MTLKLKQILAIEYSTKTRSKNLEITEAYIAGFDKAKALCADIMHPFLRSIISRSTAAKTCFEMGENLQIEESNEIQGTD